MQLIIITIQPSSNQANQLYQSTTHIKLLVFFFNKVMKQLKKKVEEQRANQQQGTTEHGTGEKISHNQRQPNQP